MVDSAKSPFALRLYHLRLRRKMHQHEMATMLHIPRGTYANYESGGREPDIMTLVHLASRLGVSLDYLTGSSDFELPVESGVKYGILKQIRQIREDDLQPYTPRFEQPLMIADRDNGSGYSPGS